MVNAPEAEYDVILIGAGFAGTYLLWRLRKLGFKVRLIEANDKFGGVWSWNHYPGARVDSDVPTFEFTHPEIWSDWKWTERFPGQPEILRYFKYVEEKLDLRKDTTFNRRVNSAIFDEKAITWTLGTVQGEQFRTRAFVWCTGYFTKKYVPQIEGLGDFKGRLVHTSEWPAGGIDVAGKRVGVLGTGASGVQLIQDIAGQVKSLTVLQRTPNTALPMQQSKLGPMGHDKAAYPAAFARLVATSSGFLYAPLDKSAHDATPEEREEFFGQLYKTGGFSFYLGGYNDVMTDVASNAIAYDYWRRRTWERIQKPELREVLAPRKPLHSFGAKRPCLEQRFYEVFNQDNVELLDLRTDPIAKVTETGVTQESGKHTELDILVTATGYDAILGGYKDVDIQGRGGKSLTKDAWGNNTVYTFNGLSTSGFPNMFYVFGPQSPFANGPTACEMQANWLVDMFVMCREKGISSVESKPESDKKYKKLVNEWADSTVLGIGAGWFWGTNVPGGRNEANIFMGGVPVYKKLIDQETESGYASYVLQ